MKFSKNRDIKQSFPLSSIQNEPEADRARYGQSKDAGIVVTNSSKIDSSKSTNTSTDDLVISPNRKYSPA